MPETGSSVLKDRYARFFDDSVQRRLGGLKPARFAKGTVLFRPGDEPPGFLLVLSGRVGVFLTGRSGREILLYSVEPGETCIQTTIGLLGSRAYTGEAVAETDVEAVVVPTGDFSALMRESDSFRSFVFAAFGDRFADVTSVLEQVAFVAVEQRLAACLLERADTVGTITMTHGEIATHIGSSREVVSRRLVRLRQDGIVELERGSVRITDRARLARLAED